MIKSLLIVGYGSIGKRHAKLARSLMPKAKIIVLKRKLIKKTKDKIVDKFVSNLSDAIKFKPEIAIIANPASYHLSAAFPLIELGIHLLIEKPLSISSKNISKLIYKSNLKKSVLMVGYNLRFMQSLIKFREILQKKIIGKVLSVRSEVGSYLPKWRPGIDYKKSVSATKALGGGVLLELSHDIDYLFWLFGKVQWVSATLHKQSKLKIDTEDTALITLGFSDIKNNNKIVANLNMDFNRHDTTRFCKVIGEKGTLHWNAVNGTIKLFWKDTNKWKSIYKKKKF